MTGVFILIESSIRHELPALLQNDRFDEESRLVPAGGIYPNESQVSGIKTPTILVSLKISPIPHSRSTNNVVTEAWAAGPASDGNSPSVSAQSQSIDTAR
jgi:hypothetical protein